MSGVSIYQAKARLTELVRLAERGQEVVIPRHGRPVAIIQAAFLTLDREPGAVAQKLGFRIVLPR